ncbi:MAG: polysaccharide deacetylase family protein [Flavobacteriales bacterium]|nr:polysaccharide deacetylase family protein [Flavobacteriales bacterium]MCB9166276.1 polysaccharide deacetylase family protein [Flavobacteriales bacterium]
MVEPLGRRIERKLVEWGAIPVGGAGRACVLMYHGVGDPGSDRTNVRHIGSDVFRHHLALFKAHFHVVSLEALFAGERSPDRLTVALTFDDGARNLLTHALPLLEEQEVPASFFVTGANPLGLRILWGDLLDLSEGHTDQDLVIGGERFRKNTLGRYQAEHGGILLRDRIKAAGTFAMKAELYARLEHLIDGPLQRERTLWELLSDRELHDLAAHPLIELGAHGWAHNDMGRIPPEDAESELKNIAAYLSGLTGRPVRSLAWPSGSYSRRNVEDAAALGFVHQLAVDLRHAEDAADPRIRERYGVYHFPVHDRFLLHLIARTAR